MLEVPKISMRIHPAGGKLILAACDVELLGKILLNGDIEFKVSQYFYGGDVVNDDTFLNMVDQVTCANIIGNHCIDILIKGSYIEKDVVIDIDGISHVQIFDISHKE